MCNVMVSVRLTFLKIVKIAELWKMANFGFVSGIRHGLPYDVHISFNGNGNRSYSVIHILMKCYWFATPNFNLIDLTLSNLQVFENGGTLISLSHSWSWIIVCPTLRFLQFNTITCTRVFMALWQLLIVYQHFIFD